MAGVTRARYVGYYHTDQGAVLRMHVREDHLLNPIFGWGTVQGWGLESMVPPSLKPRVVYGKSLVTGRTSKAICASLTAPYTLAR